MEIAICFVSVVLCRLTRKKSSICLLHILLILISIFYHCSILHEIEPIAALTSAMIFSLSFSKSTRRYMSL